MAKGDKVRATSMESFAQAAEEAFRQVKGDPNREGAASAEVSRMWLEKGGVVGATQFNVELTILHP